MQNSKQIKALKSQHPKAPESVVQSEHKVRHSFIYTNPGVLYLQTKGEKKNHKDNSKVR